MYWWNTTRSAHFGWIIGLSLLFFSCAPTRLVKPLEQGQKSVSAHFGGPIIDLGLVMPIPFGSIYGAYGLKEDLSIYSGLNITSAMSGVIHLDAGATYGLMADSKGWKPGLSVSPAANFMMDVYEGNFRFYPQLAANAWWDYGNRGNYVYVGTENWFELRNQRAHGESQTQRIIPGIHIGHSLVRNRMEYRLEGRWIAPFNTNDNIVVRYKGIANQGSTGLYIAISRKF